MRSTRWPASRWASPCVIEETFPLACSPKELEEFIDGSTEARRWLDRLLLGQDARQVAPLKDDFGRHDPGLAGVVREKGEGDWEGPSMNETNIGRYRHYKGNEYTVIGTARHSETLEELVVYRQEYGEHGLWVRPKQMFSETVKIDGRDVPRFQPLGSSSEQVGEGIKNIFDDLPQHLPKEACPDAHSCRRRAHRADHLARPRISRRLLVRPSRSTNGSSS